MDLATTQPQLQFQPRHLLRLQHLNRPLLLPHRLQQLQRLTRVPQLPQDERMALLMVNAKVANALLRMDNALAIKKVTEEDLINAKPKLVTKLTTKAFNADLAKAQSWDPKMVAQTVIAMAPIAA